MINIIYKNRIIISFVYLFANIILSQNSTEDSEYERRMKLAEQYMKKNASKKVVKTKDTLKLENEDKLIKKVDNKSIHEDKEKDIDDSFTDSNRIKTENSKFMEYFKKRKLLIYSGLSISSISAIIYLISSKEPDKAYSDFGAIGNPPNWPNDP